MDCALQHPSMPSQPPRLSVALGLISRAPAPRQLELAFYDARPVVKWVGGKGGLLEQIEPLLPDDIAERRVFEPFAGGAALFFRLRPRRAVLSDINAQLMAVYRCVRSSAPALIQALRTLEQHHSIERYYEVRAQYNATRRRTASVERCAQFVYLNKTCFNGLHRVNRRGEFNVPAGSYRAPRILDTEALLAASRELQSVKLRCGSFEKTLSAAVSGDFIFLDSPYDVAPGTAGFTSYAASRFGPREQDKQAAVFRALDRRGCKLMLSNSDTPANRSRYAGFHIVEVLAPRSINRDGAGRNAVTELVVRNY